MQSTQQTSFVLRAPVPPLPDREQPIHRLREVGAYGVSTAELLALVLHQQDLAEAHCILGQFTSLTALANATEEQLTRLPGIGPKTAAALHAALELGRRLVSEAPLAHPQIRSPADAAARLLPLIGQQEQEHFAILYLNTRNHVTDKEVRYKGSLNTSPVRIAEVFRGAARRNCAAIIVAHNHPSGDSSPSPEDVALTRRLVEAGQLMEIEVLLPLVIGRNRYLSLRERKLGFDWRTFSDPTTPPPA